MKKYFPILILILILGLYLGIKALNENGWDGWQADAQVLLSAKHWAKDGFLKNYFLFIPQGYSKVVRYFDDPELRQHARGIATGGLIGKRLYYTHYPFGYILPTALLMKLGAQNRFWFRLLQILFSLTGLVFLYWAFTLISKSRLIAFLGTLFYGISTIFLDYADSLAAMPLEELLRAVIIILSIVALKNPTDAKALAGKQKKYFNYLIWILYFALSISSYDSTFFIFAWLVGLDILFNKKLNWRLWILWASAPILAFAVQLLQNYLYLGWHNMLLDLYGTVKVQVVGSRSGFFISHLRRLIEPFGWFFGVKWYLGILISVLGIAAVRFLKKYYPEKFTFDIRFLYLGFAAVFFHFLFFPSLFFYQARIISIFGAFLVGILTAYLFKIVRQKNFGIIASGIFILMLGLWLIQGQRTYAYIKNWPNNVWPIEKIDFDKKIKNLISGDKVIFQMLGQDQEISGTDRYPAPASEDEYYTDAPILGFTNIDDLIRDFNYLKKRSKFLFSAIIITDQKTTIEKISQKLIEYKTRPIEKMGNKFVLVID